MTFLTRKLQDYAEKLQELTPSGIGSYESYKCPTGTYSETGSISISDCQDCDFGYPLNS